MLINASLILKFLLFALIRNIVIWFIYNVKIYQIIIEIKCYKSYNKKLLGKKISVINNVKIMKGEHVV